MLPKNTLSQTILPDDFDVLGIFHINVCNIIYRNIAKLEHCYIGTILHMNIDTQEVHTQEVYTQEVYTQEHYYIGSLHNGHKHHIECTVCDKWFNKAGKLGHHKVSVHEGLFLVRSVTNNLMKLVNSDIIRCQFMKDLFFCEKCDI